MSRWIKGKSFYNKPWYNSYRSMMSRCYNPNTANYKLYGGRGIKVCDEWFDIENFEKWVEESNFKKGLTLDRIDTNGNYEPSNCRWATKAQQANNKTNTIVIEWNGEAHTISEWAKITGINRSTLNNRHCRGWSAERMLTAPVTHGNQYTFYKAEREAKKCHAT